MREHDHKPVSVNGSQIESEVAMKDYDMIRIVGRCYESEHSAKPDEGNYFAECERKIIKDLIRRGLIRAHEVSGKIHWFAFDGFTNEGRAKYLDANGNIRPEYAGWNPSKISF